MSLNNYRRLAKALKTPPMFTDVLLLIVEKDEVDLLLKLSEKECTAVELSKLLNIPQNIVESKVDSLFSRGFLCKRRKKETYYSTEPFQSIANRFLSENRTESLGKYTAKLANRRMEEHVKRAEKDPYPESKVLPLPQAILEIPINHTIPRPVAVILPYETAVNVLEKARSFSLRDCECRATYKNCDKPLPVCIALNEFSDMFVERGVAKEISLEEAKKVLQTASEQGLVHQVIYEDWLKGEVRDLCSCCSCCCQYLRALINYGFRHHVARSGLVAKVDFDKCVGCGACVERCVFGARTIKNGKSIVTESSCYGCGLCVTLCPTGAVELSSSISGTRDL